jgi:uncharacterized protein with HEPN domain
MPREVLHVLTDILTAIERIEEFAAGHDELSIVEDAKSYLAIQRCLEIISEATRAIPPELQLARPEIPWARIRAFGNVMRHEYDGIAPVLIWRVVIDELPRLKRAVAHLREQKQ